MVLCNIDYDNFDTQHPQKSITINRVVTPREMVDFETKTLN